MPVALAISFHLVEHAKCILNLVNVHKRAVVELAPTRGAWNSMYIGQPEREDRPLLLHAERGIVQNVLRVG